MAITLDSNRIQTFPFNQFRDYHLCVSKMWQKIRVVNKGQPRLTINVLSHSPPTYVVQLVDNSVACAEPASAPSAGT